LRKWKKEKEIKKKKFLPLNQLDHKVMEDCLLLRKKPKLHSKAKKQMKNSTQNNRNKKKSPKSQMKTQYLTKIQIYHAKNAHLVKETLI
jgi:hypothetical protein